MTLLVLCLLIFLAVGTFFLFIHLMIGKLIRPAKPEDDKLTIYECGEPTVGSAWIQFDLRYYVVALLFVIFDVEVAFFFPWAVVFGQANDLARSDVVQTQKQEDLSRQFNPSDEALPRLPDEERGLVEPEAARSFAWLSMVDIAIFFGVLMMGFAYLWRRGDLDWVRSTANAPATSGLSELPPLPEVAGHQGSTLAPAGTRT
jgi:NADH-quinone oxidoreductase subunit A